MKVTAFRSNAFKISFIILNRNSLERTPNKTRLHYKDVSIMGVGIVLIQQHENRGELYFDNLESPFTLQNICSLQLLAKLKPYVHD